MIQTNSNAKMGARDKLAKKTREKKINESQCKVLPEIDSEIEREREWMFPGCEQHDESTTLFSADMSQTFVSSKHTLISQKHVPELVVQLEPVTQVS